MDSLKVDRSLFQTAQRKKNQQIIIWTENENEVAVTIDISISVPKMFKLHFRVLSSDDTTFKKHMHTIIVF